MDNKIITIYVNLIKWGLKTLDDIPKHIRLAVETALFEDSNI